MNRYFRRMRQFGKSFSAKRGRGEDASENTQDAIFDANRPEDVKSTRAKSQAKGKVTADKWNQ